MEDNNIATAATSAVQKNTKTRIGITIGDINGVGPETIIKVLADTRITKLCTPIIYGSGKVLTRYKRILGIENFSYHQYNNNSYINEKKANVVNCWYEVADLNPGKVTKAAGKYALDAIRKSTLDLKKGFIDAVVTSPINKATIQTENFQFPGHTEYYAKTFEAEKYLMLLCSNSLKVGVVTGHVPISEVSQHITKENIKEKLMIMLQSLKDDFGILKPRIAVLGLNPHAGENGLIGKEEQEQIIPAITEIAKKGNIVYGPFSADGFFASMSYKKFDGILAMYHDQGLIPFKTLAFGNGVNYTAGLPIIRTSPDHGTAYNIAGKGKADESSLREAIFLACDIVENRKNKVTNQLRKKARTTTERKHTVYREIPKGEET